jgi:peptidoglycan/xylan/chitin deacetylase (PgdA/CDA1 family)
MYHNDLTKIPASLLATDFNTCKGFLENAIQQKVDAFAFPYGSYNSAVTEAGLSAGFNHFLALDYRFDTPDDQLISERLVVNPYISTTNQMLAIIKGSY